jgi:hypothetical protein
MKKIGYLFLYRVPSRIYSRDEITNVLTGSAYGALCHRDSNGKPVVPYLPSAPHDADAFRKACAIVGKEFRQVKDKYQRTVKIRITDVNSDNQYIQKDIVQEIVKAKTLTGLGLHQNEITESIAKITFRHRIPGDITQKLKIHPTVPIQDAISREYWAPGVNYMDMFKSLSDTLQELTGAISDVQFRAWVGEFMKWELRGRSFSPVRGTHFLPPTEKAELFIDALRSIDGVFAQIVPLYDEGSVLSDMAEHATEDIEQEIRTLIEEIDVKKGMRSDKIKRVARELAYYAEIVAEYADMGMADKGRVVALLAKARMQLDMAVKAGDAHRERKAAERAYKKEREQGLTRVEKKGLFGEAV